MFKKFKALIENQTGSKIKKLKIDNGLEFCKSEFNEFYATQGIARHKTLVGKPQQNGLQTASIELYLRERVVCSLMLICGIVEIFRQGCFYCTLSGEAISTFLY